MLLCLVDQRSEQRRLGDDAQGQVAQLAARLLDVHHARALQVDVPRVERVAGQLAKPLAEAHLVEHLEAERHQSFAAEHALEVGFPLEQKHLGAAAHEQ